MSSGAKPRRVGARHCDQPRPGAAVCRKSRHGGRARLFGSATHTKHVAVVALFESRSRG